jgi:hypothetical protein
MEKLRSFMICSSCQMSLVWLINGENLGACSSWLKVKVQFAIEQAMKAHRGAEV